MIGSVRSAALTCLRIRMPASVWCEQAGGCGRGGWWWWWYKKRGAGGAPTWQPELRAVDDGDDDEPKQETEAKAKADAEPLDCGPIEGATGDDGGGAASEAGGTCSTADAATSSGVATPSSSRLVSHIPSQRNQQPGPHVLEGLTLRPAQQW